MNITPEWRRVNGDHPCPICRKPDYCQVSADGAVAMCMRVEAGSYRTAETKNGEPFYLHRLDGPSRVASEQHLPRSGAEVKRAAPDDLHRIYSALLSQLALSQGHRDCLQQRGLPDVEIDHRQYRSLTIQGRARLARGLVDRFGLEAVLAVPGFIVKKGKDSQTYPTIAGAAGLLVPVRDVQGRIIAIKIRCDGSKEDLAAQGLPRYSYLSSTKGGGPGPGTPAHVPLGVTGPCQCVRLTEGELKADVATFLSRVPTISAPGVAGWRIALEAARALGPSTVRLAFDADAAENRNVAAALAACHEAVLAAGLVLEVERWPAPHKAIDDALTASVSIEILTGDAARFHVWGTQARAMASGPSAPPTLQERLERVLNEGGPGGLFRDDELLKDLATMAENDPAAFAAVRDSLSRAGVRLRDLDAAILPERQALRRERPPQRSLDEYQVSGGCITHLRHTKDGLTEATLCKFSARIVEQVTVDDGAEISRHLVVEGKLCDGKPLPPVEVPAADFGRMEWIIPRWGACAVVYAGRTTAEHLRVALQQLSGQVPQRTVYGHLGWRCVGSRWYYLHAGGAIGADGPAPDIAVSVPEALTRYLLPAPGDELRRAVSSSLELLQFGPARLGFPLLAGVYRAALGPCDFALHLVGQTGAYKTEVAALMQQHFGPEMVARALPAHWASTGNALEATAFACKDALLVVDEFTPNGSADAARLQREAERLLRAQGNNAGRQRMRRDGSLAPARPPRGLILSTGEEVPSGQSLLARLLVLEVNKGDFGPAAPAVNPVLSSHQQAAAAGRFASAMAGFVCWLASQYDAVHRRLAVEAAELREQMTSDGQHARTPGILGDLALGLRYLLDFAHVVGVVSQDRKADLWKEGLQAIREAGAAQAENLREGDPAQHFLRLLSGALASGRAHVAAPNGDYPDTPTAWGWRRGESRHAPEWVPQGKRIGWVDEEGSLLLEPDASFAAAQSLASEQGQPLSITTRTLWKLLRARGLLKSWDENRQRHTIRRTLEGVRHRQVLHLRVDALRAPQEARDDEDEASWEGAEECLDPFANPFEEEQGRRA